MPVTTYTQNFTSQTSVTVLNSNHGIGSNNLTVTVFTGSNGSGSKVNKSNYTYTFNGSHDVTVTFGGSTSGSIRVDGAFSNTSNSQDWQATSGGSGNRTMTIASAATGTNYQCRSCGYPKANSRYVATKPFTAILAEGYSPAATMYVYIDGYTQEVCFGLSGGWNGPDPTVSSGCRVDHGVSGAPTGACPIAHAYCDNGGVGTIADDRPWA